MTYQVADGNDNAAGLATVTPQPASPDGLQYAEVVDAADGTADFQGFPFMDLVWTSLERTDRNTIATAFGLSDTVASNEVTVAIPLNTGSFVNRNATAKLLPRTQRGFVFVPDFTIRLVKIREI